MTGWTQIQGLSSPKELWVVPDGHGNPERGVWRAPDGRDVVDVMASGQGHTLPFEVFMRQSEDAGQRAFDMLWTQGAPVCVVSDDFVEALEMIGVQGWSTYPLAVRDLEDQPIEGYQGLLADATGTSDLVVGLWSGRPRQDQPQHYSLLALDDLVGAMKEMGVLFDHEPVTDPERVAGLSARPWG